MTTGLLETPEVNLYYTVRGAGPAILILQGGAGNADASEALANRLAGHFTVIAYDRRGLSRSTPIRAEGYEIAAHAGDAARLIRALSGEPAFVFGSSIGALIGLELVARHGELVRLLVAHEAPVYHLLADEEREEALRSHREIPEIFRREGLPAAMKIMLARSGVDMSDHEPEVPVPSLAADPKSAARRMPDLQHFLQWDVPAVTRYQPDVAALCAAASKIVPAAGNNSSTLPYRCTVCLAGVLHRETVQFPGGHTGNILRPKAFAAKLEETLAGS
jgi:pimeloyl-ACP methyl ester carboxylesterase